MIDEIHIRNVALIEEAFFEPSEGFTVITGETGAGKTALLSAIKLLMGQRSDATLVRAGQSELRVEGQFVDDEEHLVSRRVTSAGRSRIMLDGELSSARVLQDVVANNIDFCGQHEHQHLLNPIHQRELFDAWAGSSVQILRKEYQEALAQARAVQKQLDDVVNDDDVQERLENARFVIAQFEAVAPEEGEYEQLIAELPRYEHAERLMSSSHEAHDIVRGSDETLGILDLLEQLQGRLDIIAQIDADFSSDASRVRDIYYEMDDMSRKLARYVDTIDFSPEELEDKQNRLSHMQGLLRAYGPTMQMVFDAYASACEVLQTYEARDETIERLKAQLAQAEECLAQRAAALAEKRAECAPAFCDAVGAYMAQLEMGSAFVRIEFSDIARSQWNNWGSQTFELLFAPSATMEPQRLSRIASGGELSRVMLAIKVVLGSLDAVDTLIFDEIDAGVGGHTARCLAEVLKQLAKTHQVIVVTHLAQVAVCADTHYVVTKEETLGQLPQTKLVMVEGEERLHEVARMLSGSTDASSLEHARTLLENAD